MKKLGIFVLLMAVLVGCGPVKIEPPQPKFQLGEKAIWNCSNNDYPVIITKREFEDNQWKYYVEYNTESGIGGRYIYEWVLRIFKTKEQEQQELEKAIRKSIYEKLKEEFKEN